ncbi:cysteine three histidine 1 [Hippocampus zosterae]|uniref:cysteine three histidine 1 n=1 Tax=Hippocampus zosterae TaxID=109293 RepID=UPI00223E0DE1|nr:cysteine three histidine 1 [Hippocampus zosterae]
MVEASSDLLLPVYHDEELVANLLSSEETSADDGALSLVEALIPVLDPPFAQLPWVCSTRYKTELCVRYASTGSCQYAERCSFAHGLRDLHVPFRHPKYKTELCRRYHMVGHCYYGSRCLFVHGAAEQRPVPQRPRRSVPCRTYSNFGICPYGTRCNFLHAEDPRSNKITPNLPKARKPRETFCRTFSTFGFCVYGTRCRFRHVVPCTVKSSEPGPGSAGPASPALESPSPCTSPQAQNAFTFSSQQLGDLLLPLALHLRQMESNKARDMFEQYQS